MPPGAAALCMHSHHERRTTDSIQISPIYFKINATTPSVEQSTSTLGLTALFSMSHARPTASYLCSQVPRPTSSAKEVIARKSICFVSLVLVAANPAGEPFAGSKHGWGPTIRSDPYFCLNGLRRGVVLQQSKCSCNPYEEDNYSKFFYMHDTLLWSTSHYR